MLCDLHMHSRFSDGTYTVRELVETVASAGIQAFCLTDHDTVEGLEEAAMLAEQHGLRTLTGIEVSSAIGGVAVHVLGYGFDPGHPELLELLRNLNQARHERVPAMVERLRELGLEIDAEQVMEIAGQVSPGRPHVARALVQSGHCASVNEAFARWLGDGKPGHVQKPVPTPFEAIAVLRRAGGRAVWAHPLARPVHRPGGAEQLLREMSRAGLAGVEVVHPSQKPSQRRKLRRLARELELLETGGSDFHGDNSPGVSIGVGRGGDQVPVSHFEDLL